MGLKRYEPCFYMAVIQREHTYKKIYPNEYKSGNL